MKHWLREIWGLFVDDAWLAGLAVVALGLAGLLAAGGHRLVAGLTLFLAVSAALWWRSRAR
ncbi:conserved protein of unknown function [Candidatus Hydrogenisulfobacillus filiaventi]|uniref:Uncharacterized protein n=1 Tax=Candidatus Hydrogenisulfobacillus filiaventi TaxID=2707344 RepID=A0A6F8ZJ00_9FIRM|nr:hypothetical protein [Bacillota bacterium]CAB1129705.1 conserved protein of unknown function [Candidatus Hydrogenisulfobacillus filiaventi]